MPFGLVSYKIVTMKFKKIPTDYLILCLDRLTRFKPTGEKYKRVFSDIVNKFGSNGENNESASEIVNTSVEKTFENDFFINNLIKDFEISTFFQDDESQSFLDNNINYNTLFSLLENKENLPNNLKWLLLKNSNRAEDFLTLREKFACLYPLECVILCEGATEEALLPELARLCGYDFDKNGIYLFAAGGKNQVGRKYLKMLDEVKLPIFILLDADAVEIKDAIMAKKRDIDEIYLIKKGEFEDILPKKLIADALNFNFSNERKCSFDDFEEDLKMAKNLELIFKLKGFGDFKKSSFANIVKNYILNSPNCLNNSDFSEITNIVEGIKNCACKK